MVDNEWISIEDELPEFDNIPVLFWVEKQMPDSDSGGYFGWYSNKIYDGTRGLWFDIYGHAVYGVTHWMPFPKGPDNILSLGIKIKEAYEY
jgi:hypothetical protein